MGAAQPSRSQAARYGTAGRKAAKEGNTPGPSHAYHVKELRNQEMQIARQAQKGYEHFVEAWRPRPPKERVRWRLKPAGLE